MYSVVSLTLVKTGFAGTWIATQKLAKIVEPENSALAKHKQWGALPLPLHHHSHHHRHQQQQQLGWGGQCLSSIPFWYRLDLTIMGWSLMTMTSPCFVFCYFFKIASCCVSCFVFVLIMSKEEEEEEEEFNIPLLSILRSLKSCLDSCKKLGLGQWILKNFFLLSKQLVPIAYYTKHLKFHSSSKTHPDFYKLPMIRNDGRSESKPFMLNFFKKNNL